MSTTLAFRDSPYAHEQTATVVAVDGDGVVVTDSTIFYPHGGGQPGDSGVFVSADGREIAVVDTRKGEAGAVNHHLAADHDLAVGERIIQRLDWSRRHAHMRMHTALHLLAVAIPHGVTGGSIGAERGRLDFDLGDVTLDKAELDARLATLIAADYPVSTEWISDAELDANPALVRTMSVAPPRGVGEIRMVRIGDVDYQPCGGTHVAATAEIGGVRVASIKNRGARNRRVTLVWDDAEGQS
ncbi:alanyl-tRNA editing protein [Salinicola aestuarinus]|uniref:alanyl-tRNA editing protein n=1 Tax=Salinicola aestuarinus TaxID=1949082 RepID=UPI000DA1DB63|nr:alanyl-tRNA editing protein [Salinicola aestuarinus]